MRNDNTRQKGARDSQSAAVTLRPAELLSRNAARPLPLAGWDQVGEANWKIEDGAIVATEGKDRHLVSKDSYKNLIIYAEFWSDEKANSGIFVRCKDPNKIGARDCYEMNIFDSRLDRATAPARLSILPRESRSKSRRQVEHVRNHRGQAASHGNAQLARKPLMSTTAFSKKDTSRCNTVRA